MGNKQSKSAGIGACFGRGNRKKYGEEMPEDLPEQMHTIGSVGSAPAGVSTPKQKVKKSSTLSRLISASPLKQGKNKKTTHTSPESNPVGVGIDTLNNRKKFSLNDPKPVDLVQVNLSRQSGLGDNANVNQTTNIDSLFTTASKPKIDENLLKIESAKIALEIIQESLQNLDSSEKIEDAFPPPKSSDLYGMNEFDHENEEVIDLVVVHSKIQQESTKDEKDFLQDQWEMNKFQLARSKSIEKQKSESNAKNNAFVNLKKSEESSEFKSKNETSYGLSELKSDPTLDSSVFRSRNSSMVHTDSAVNILNAQESTEDKIVELPLKKVTSRRSSVVYNTDSIGNHSLSKKSKSSIISQLPIKIVPLRIIDKDDPFISSSSETKVDSHDFDNATENDFLNSLHSEETEGSMLKFIKVNKSDDTMAALCEPVSPCSRSGSRRQSSYSLGIEETEEIIKNQKKELRCWEVNNYQIGLEEEDNQGQEINCEIDNIARDILETLPHTNTRDSGVDQMDIDQSCSISKPASLVLPIQEIIENSQSTFLRENTTDDMAEAADFSNLSHRTLDDKYLTTLEEDNSNITPRTVRTTGQNTTANDLTPDSRKNFPIFDQQFEDEKEKLQKQMETLKQMAKNMMEITSGDQSSTLPSGLPSGKKERKNSRGEASPAVSPNKQAEYQLNSTNGLSPVSPSNKRKYNNRKRNKNKKRSSSKNPNDNGGVIQRATSELTK